MKPFCRETDEGGGATCRRGNWSPGLFQADDRAVVPDDLVGEPPCQKLAGAADDRGGGHADHWLGGACGGGEQTIDQAFFGSVREGERVCVGKPVAVSADHPCQAVASRL